MPVNVWFTAVEPPIPSVVSASISQPDKAIAATAAAIATRAGRVLPVMSFMPSSPVMSPAYTAGLSMQLACQISPERQIKCLAHPREVGHAVFVVKRRRAYATVGDCALLSTIRKGRRRFTTMS